MEATATRCAAGSLSRILVNPVDHGKALLNPDMGWNFAYYTDNREQYGDRLPEDDRLDWFPGCNSVSFRVGWRMVEPEEGKFNWSFTDRIAERWVDKGKQVSYCWIVLSTGGMQPCAPLWLRDAGAGGFLLHHGDVWTPRWNDPVYIEKLGNFLRAAAERYDGKNWVSFVEIGSLGLWGEGHTYKMPEVRIEEETKVKHLDLWRRHFKETQLIVNDDYKQEAVDYARGLGYGLADWSILVDGGRGYRSDHMAQAFWPSVPVVLEHEHYGIAARRRRTWGDGSTLVRAVEDYHASHMRIHWWPKEFLNGNGEDLAGNSEVVDKINRRIGYRIQIMEASWPETIIPGEDLRVQFTLRNGGVAPCYGGGFPAVTLKNQQARTVCTAVDTDINVRSLVVGESVEKARALQSTISVKLPGNTPPATYAVYLSVGKADGTPVIALPHDNDDGERRYKLGNVAIH